MEIILHPNFLNHKINFLMVYVIDMINNLLYHTNKNQYLTCELIYNSYLMKLTLDNVYNIYSFMN